MFFTWFYKKASNWERGYLILVIFVSFIIFISAMNRNGLYKNLFVLYLISFLLLVIATSIGLEDNILLKNYNYLPDLPINIFISYRLIAYLLFLYICQFTVICIDSLINFMVLGDFLSLTFYGYLMLFATLSIYNIFLVILINFIVLKNASLYIKPKNLNSKWNDIGVICYFVSFFLYGLYICIYIYIYFNKHEINILQSISRTTLQNYTSFMIGWFILLIGIYMALSVIFLILSKNEIKKLILKKIN